MDYQYIKNFQHDDVLMQSYFDFTQQVFGFDLALWRDAGYWDSKYIPHSLIYNNRVIANISAALMQMQIQGKEVSAVQFGSVGVLPEYRGQGLARILTEKVLAEYSQVPVKLLFADEDALGFYRKVGFRPVNEIAPYLDVARPVMHLEPVKLTTDSPELHHLLASELQHSSILDARGNNSFYWFHLMYSFRDNIYYIPEKDVIFVARYNGDTVSIYDIVAAEPVTFAEIQDYILTAETTRVKFFFTPDWLGVDYAGTPETNNNLHVLGDFPEEIGNFRFPIMAQT